MVIYLGLALRMHNCSLLLGEWPHTLSPFGSVVVLDLGPWPWRVLEDKF